MVILTEQQNKIVLQDCEHILNQSSLRWEQLRDKRLFLTGGTGFFGKWLLHSFLYINSTLKLNASLTVLSRSPEKFLKNNPCFRSRESLYFADGDIRDFAFPDRRFDYLIHAATPASAEMEKENPGEMASVIVDGTKRVLAFAGMTGVQKALFTSSGAVYGVQPTNLSHIPESYPPQPATVYGKAKLEAEHLFASSSVNSVIARCFAFIGPCLPIDIHFAAGNFIRDGLSGRTITVMSDGRPYRSYLYTTDLIEWLWTLLINGKPGEVYNVGSEEAVSISELAITVSECFSDKTAVSILGNADTNIPAPRYVPDTHKAQKELHLNQHCPLIDGIMRTISWYRSV